MTSMSIRLASIFLALSGVVAVFPGRALSPGAARLSAGLYPAHARLSTIDPLSNQEMDCYWGFACSHGRAITSSPVFHLQSQDQVHRVSGWAQFGDATRNQPHMLFALFFSRYASGGSQGLPWNVSAFVDFRTALMNKGFSDMTDAPRVLPPVTPGNSSANLEQSATGDVLTMVSWTGSIEVEGMVVYPHGSAAERRLAIQDLRRQMRAALGHV